MIKTTSKVVLVDGADGKKHWHVDSWQFASDVKTNARFEFDNLFNGNKILGKTTPMIFLVIPIFSSVPSRIRLTPINI